MACDAWSEAEHQRGEGGQFGPGRGQTQYGVGVTKRAVPLAPREPTHWEQMSMHLRASSNAHKRGYPDVSRQRFDMAMKSQAAHFAEEKAAKTKAKRAATIAAKKSAPIAQDRALFERRQAHDGLAFDRASVRTTDRDGRLHVEVTNISKAAVNPYLGREIPDSQALGLDPNQVYHLFRDPAELKKGAPTFNNLPLLSEHVPVSAAAHRPELVIGSTGTDAEFVAPYLRNSLVVWAASAIEGIESGAQRELSCAYRYRADMKPGTYQGERFDGRMVDLIGNHVAVVATGRAGPDVVVGDSLPTEIENMKNKAHPSRMAILARGALLAVLGQDSRPDLSPILAGVTAGNWKARKPGIIAAVKPKLAHDADISSVVRLLDSLDGEEKHDDNLSTDDDMGADPGAVDPGEQLDAVDADPVAEVLAMLKGKISDEDLAAIQAKLCPPAADADEPASAAGDPAEDPTGDPAVEPIKPPAGPFTPAPPATSEKDKDMVSKPAMDAAIDAARKQSVIDGRKLAREINEAEKIVRPFVGDVVAQDSAEGVYKAALGMLGVKTAGIHPSAFRAVLEAQPKPGADRRPVVAMDTAAAKTINDRFPNLARLTVG